MYYSICIMRITQCQNKKISISFSSDHVLFPSRMKYVLDSLDGDVQVIKGANYYNYIKIGEGNKNLSIALFDLFMPGFDSLLD